MSRCTNVTQSRESSPPTAVGPQPLIVATTADNWAGTNPVLKVDTVQKGVNPLSGTFRCVLLSVHWLNVLTCY